MFSQQRQSLDVKPLPPPPREMSEKTDGSEYPRQTTSDQRDVAGLFKKIASKLKSPAPGQLNTASTTAKATSTVRVKNAPPLANDFTSKEQREAALRARGLIAAPRKDLSQQEEDLDKRHAKTSPIPRDQTTKGDQPSAAEKIIQEWKAKNKAGRP